MNDTRQFENYTLDHDITLLCVTASSFPDGIADAHRELRMLAIERHLPYRYGISHPDLTGGITYWAGAEATHLRGVKRGLKEFVLKKGWYTSAVLRNYEADVLYIGRTFIALLARPDIDEHGACIEWYFNDQDVRCMVRLESGR